MKWTREGGFRWRWLARMTRGHWGMGRWTREEIESINERARKQHEELKKYVY